MACLSTGWSWTLVAPSWTLVARIAHIPWTLVANLIERSNIFLIACATRVQVDYSSLTPPRSLMAKVHQLILSHGIDEARRQAATRHERALVEAAYQVLGEESEGVGFTYSGFALTSLPHKEQQERVWKREGHNLTLVLQSGIDRQGNEVGLPYGSYARFILLFLQSEAVKTRSRGNRAGKKYAGLAGPYGPFHRRQ